ncbi:MULTISPECIES: acyl-CoA thioesterase [Paenibacillus]|uniref:Acyl-CoA thioester hydrolase YkhA n=1 Tax=Paenibacillus radicis (ex Gao et al. 2016) TaxID=1737354 RepID=A0A917HRX2_9BACL|nr:MULTISPECIES: acyl-CoA thioesterase [Paenibacillus]GGG88280.1 putative acyl-CoA thioester hydrolase YkhA [Paenibacillus radicis (ex Gao et al. 2016)]
MEKAGKKAKESRTVMTQIIFPLDTNHHDTMFGGKVMEYMDKVAAISAMRHARMQVVTASTDSLDFVAPIKVGEVIEIEAYVTRTNHSSMEVYVSVQSENLFSGHKTTTVTAFFTFVALDDYGKPAQVAPIIPETEEECSLYESAPERYMLRKKRIRQRNLTV